MAEVTGPCSTMPGAIHTLPEGTMCDDHPDRPAIKRVQGETDSFGSELHDMCAECYEQHKVDMEAYRKEIATGCCDWCKNGATDLRQMRDFEEGSAGPLYMVCGACRKRQADELAEEANARDDFLDYHESDLDCDSDDDDNYDHEVEVEEPTEGPELPAHLLPPTGYPRAYVDGQFIY